MVTINLTISVVRSHVCDVLTILCHELVTLYHLDRVSGPCKSAKSHETGLQEPHYSPHFPTPHQLLAHCSLSSPGCTALTEYGFLSPEYKIFILSRFGVLKPTSLLL